MRTSAHLTANKFRSKLALFTGLLLVSPLLWGADDVNNDLGRPVGGNLLSPSADGADFRLIARVTAELQYDDNLFIQARNEKSDFSFHLAPTLSAGVGNFRTELAPFSPVPHLLVITGEEEISERNFAFISYTPEAVFFQDYSSENTLNHDVKISGQRDNEPLRLQGNLGYQNYSDASIEVGGRLRQVAYTGNADGEYNVTGKTSVGLRFQGMHTDYEGANSATDGRASVYINYDLASKTKIGFGYTLGRLDVDRGGDQTYSRPWLEARYEATSKLFFRGQIGDDIRSFPAVSSRSRFVFAANGTYVVGETFQVMLEAQRDVQSSAVYASENIVSSTYQIGSRRRFLSRNFLSGYAGYTTNWYEPNESIPVQARSDNYHFYKVGVERDVTTRGSLQLRYEFRKNVSSLRDFNFDENVVTATFSFVF